MISEKVSIANYRRLHIHLISYKKKITKKNNNNNNNKYKDGKNKR